MKTLKSTDRPRSWWVNHCLDFLPKLGKNSGRIMLVGILLAPLFWILDVAIDTFLFEQGESFYSMLVAPEPSEFYMRIVVCLMLIAFGFHAGFLLKRSEQLSEDLAANKAKLELLTKELEHLAETDPLTGILNRRKFNDLLEIAIANVERHRHSIALLMMDIDHFKLINDRFGHQIGDEVLSCFCTLIDASIRSVDQFFRLGGEEFCLIATVAEGDDIRTLAEKIRHSVEIYTFPKVGRVTVSIGVTDLRKGDTQDSLCFRADHAMYEAKQRGRNCIVVSDDQKSQ